MRTGGLADAIEDDGEDGFDWTLPSEPVVEDWIDLKAKGIEHLCLLFSLIYFEYRNEKKPFYKGCSKMILKSVRAFLAS